MEEAAGGRLDTGLGLLDGPARRCSTEGVRFELVTVASPEQVREALTDFSPRRLQTWSRTLDPKTYEVRVDGRLAPGVSSKDIILALIARIGIGGGTGHVFEYSGEAIRALTMEQRMTICNMSIEGGARAGLTRTGDPDPRR